MVEAVVFILGAVTGGSLVGVWAIWRSAHVEAELRRLRWHRYGER